MQTLYRHLSPLFLSGLLVLTLTGCPGQQQQPTAPPKDDAARLAALQQQQQAAAVQAQHDADLKKQVAANKKRSNSFYVAKSKVWQKYIP